MHNESLISGPPLPSKTNWDQKDEKIGNLPMIDVCCLVILITLHITHYIHYVHVPCVLFLGTLQFEDGSSCMLRESDNIFFRRVKIGSCASINHKRRYSRCRSHRVNRAVDQKDEHQEGQPVCMAVASAVARSEWLEIFCFSWTILQSQDHVADSYRCRIMQCAMQCAKRDSCVHVLNIAFVSVQHTLSAYLKLHLFRSVRH